MGLVSPVAAAAGLTLLPGEEAAVAAARGREGEKAALLYTGAANM